MSFSWRGLLLGGLGQTPDPNKSQYQDRDMIMGQITSGLAGAANRAAPQAGGVQVAPVAQGTAAQIDQGRYNEWRGRQMGLADQLGRVATGQEAGAGELAVQRQIQNGLAGQQATARMARGGGAGMALRNMAAGAGALATTGAGLGQQAAMGDQAAARGQLAQVLGQGAGQDIGVAQGNASLSQQMNLANLDAKNQQIFQQAGLDQATSLANLQARLQTMGMNDAQIQAYMSALLGMNATELQARMAQEQAALGQKGILGDLMSGAGMIGAAYAGRPKAG